MALLLERRELPESLAPFLRLQEAWQVKAAGQAGSSERQQQVQAGRRAQETAAAVVHALPPRPR
jgi:hypothetical protein